MAGFLETLFGAGQRLLPGYVSPRDGAGPESPSWDAIHMAPLWCLIEDVLAGHDVIKARGPIYLPQFEKETLAKYKRRLLRCSLAPRVQRGGGIVDRASVRQAGDDRKHDGDDLSGDAALRI